VYEDGTGEAFDPISSVPLITMFPLQVRLELATRLKASVAVAATVILFVVDTLLMVIVVVRSSPHVYVLSIVMVCPAQIRTRSPSTGTDAPPSHTATLDANPEPIE
jgi:hypothetical protein